MNKESTVKVRLDHSLAREFAARCRELGLTQSGVLRDRIEAWLRQTDEIKRLKAGVKK